MWESYLTCLAENEQRFFLHREMWVRNLRQQQGGLNLSAIDEKPLGRMRAEVQWPLPQAAMAA